VVDPRRTEPARRADAWLQVRPGTEGALALGIAGVMIEGGWFDEPFVREWTNGPLLVRSDTGRLLTEADLSEGGDPGRYVAWDPSTGRPAVYDPARGRCEVDPADLALFGEHALETPRGGVRCRTALDLAAARCRTYTPEKVESITGVARGEIERAARLLWEARPLAYYAWSGVEMQTNSTHIARAIAQLSVLTVVSLPVRRLAAGDPGSDPLDEQAVELSGSSVFGMCAEPRTRPTPIAGRIAGPASSTGRSRRPRTKRCSSANGRRLRRRTSRRRAGPS
jgi:hypothetical protein